MSGDIPKTIIYPEAFMRSLPAGFDGLYHWDFWQPAIARRGIRPGDIDAVVEINNFFLMAETKDEGLILRDDDGSGLTRRALLNTGLVTFIYQWGKKEPTAWQWETFKEKSPIYTHNRRATIKEDVACFIHGWATHHDSIDNQAWRQRLLDAALAPAKIGRYGHIQEISQAVRQQLIERLRQENRQALGDFGETQLGNSALEI